MNGARENFTARQGHALRDHLPPPLFSCCSSTTATARTRFAHNGRLPVHAVVQAARGAHA